MSAVKTPSLEALKRPKMLLTLGTLLLLVGVWYFAWWSPEGHKLAAVQSQQLTEQQKVDSLQSTLALIDHETSLVQKYRNFLSFYGSEIPLQPEQGQLVFQLGNLEKSDNVQVTSIDVSTTNPAVSGSSLSTVPVTMSVSGPHSNVMKFLSDLYQLPRLMTIQTVTPSPTSGTTKGYNVLTHDSVPFSLSITGTAYFTGTVSTTSTG